MPQYKNRSGGSDLFSVCTGGPAKVTMESASKGRRRRFRTGMILGSENGEKPDAVNETGKLALHSRVLYMSLLSLTAHVGRLTLFPSKHCIAATLGTLHFSTKHSHTVVLFCFLPVLPLSCSVLLEVNLYLTHSALNTRSSTLSLSSTRTQRSHRSVNAKTTKRAVSDTTYRGKEIPD